MFHSSKPQSPNRKGERNAPWFLGMGLDRKWCSQCRKFSKYDLPNILVNKYFIYFHSCELWIRSAQRWLTRSCSLCDCNVKIGVLGCRSPHWLWDLLPLRHSVQSECQDRRCGQVCDGQWDLFEGSSGESSHGWPVLTQLSTQVNSQVYIHWK